MNVSNVYAFIDTHFATHDNSTTDDVLHKSDVGNMTLTPKLDLKTQVANKKSEQRTEQKHLYQTNDRHWKQKHPESANSAKAVALSLCCD